MKYLEDDLAEQCLSQTLYPDTKIIVRRKKADDLPNSFTNELEVIVNFDPRFFSLMEVLSETFFPLETVEEPSSWWSAKDLATELISVSNLDCAEVTLLGIPSFVNFES